MAKTEQQVGKKCLPIDLNRPWYHVVTLIGLWACPPYPQVWFLTCFCEPSYRPNVNVNAYRSRVFFWDQSIKEEPRRISFMYNEDAESCLLPTRKNSSRCASTATYTSLYSYRSSLSRSRQASEESDYFNQNETLLLDMVRSKSQEIEDEIHDRTSALPGEDQQEQKQPPESWTHGLCMRTERSMSRSRISRMSTKRDMDIPSILAYSTSINTAPVHIEIPAFQNIFEKREEMPKWSIRRSVCPVCSQKWRDRSSIINIKSSGLKRNLLLDLPSVKAPARLRKSVTKRYDPLPVPAAVDDGLLGSLKNSSASWQLIRARRLRLPKPQIPPPEAIAPPSCSAPMAKKDLDLRVSKFLTDTFLDK